MKLNKYYLLIITLIPSFLFALESDESKFMAKDRENTLRIINYKNELELQRKEDEQKKKEKEEAEHKAKLEKQTQQEQLDKERKEKLLLEQEKLREIQRQKLEAQEKRQAEELQRKNRFSSVKVVKLEDKDKIDFDKKPEFYMEEYSELGVSEDNTSSTVSRDNIVSTDQYIRLLLETNINSRRGGEFVAVVEKNVYSLDKKQILIAKGSKFICTFEPLEKYGETALNSECKRVYLPSGKSMFITKASLSDQMGRAGLSGEVDNRTWEKYGQTFVMSVLGGVAMLGADKIPSNDVGSLAQYTALNVVDMATQILEKTIDLAPIVIIPSATRIILKPTVDINFQAQKE